MVQFANIPALVGARADADDLVMERAGQTFRINIATLLDALLSSGAVEGNPAAAATITLEKLGVEGTVYRIPDDVVDVTEFGLPHLDATNYKQIFTDHLTPRVWVGHLVVGADVPASGTFSQYTAGPYRGEHRNNPSAPQQGQTYYNTRNHSWYYAVSAGLGSFVWAQTSIENALSANARWLGEQDDDATAASVLINFSNSLRYYFYNTSTGHVEFLDNSAPMPTPPTKCPLTLRSP